MKIVVLIVMGQVLWSLACQTGLVEKKVVVIDGQKECRNCFCRQQSWVCHTEPLTDECRHKTPTNKRCLSGKIPVNKVFKNDCFQCACNEEGVLLCNLDETCDSKQQETMFKEVLATMTKERLFFGLIVGIPNRFLFQTFIDFGKR